MPIAYDVWSSRPKKTEFVSYLDNIGAQFALVKGYASSLALTKLYHYNATVLEQGRVVVWHARVLSASNIAGTPSRQVPSALLPIPVPKKCSPALVA